VAVTHDALREDVTIFATGERAMQDLDPDLELCVPMREVRAALALTDRLLEVMGAQPALAQALVDVLTRLDDDLITRLPEVGITTDVDGLRLHLYRLGERLRCRIPSAPPSPPVPVPPPTGVIGGLRIRRPSRAGALEDDDLAEAFVWWDDITDENIAAYEAILEAASDERPLQCHLATNPMLLVQHLGGGHGRWVLSQKRLGSQYVTDFIIGERSSGGFEWQFVELQSPNAKLFVPSTGRLGPQLDEGLRQIQDWRRWLDNNRDYARRPRSRDGLGLVDVSGADPGLLIIGREVNLSDEDVQRRRQLDQQYNIRIHTYDWLVRKAKARLEELSLWSADNGAP